MHSLPLLMLAETGLVGFAALLTYCYFVYRAGLPLAWSSDRTIATLAIGVIAGASGIYAADTLSFALRLDVSMKLYWLLTGMLFSIRFLEVAGDREGAGQYRLTEEG